LDELYRNLRYGARSLRKSPGFTLVAVLTIALGIGVNSTIFSLVNAVLFRPLPVESPDQLVDIYGHTATSSSHDSNSYPNFRDYAEQTETLSGLMAYTNFFANLSIEGSSELVVGEIVSQEYFDVLGVRPARGRAFDVSEYGSVGAGPVAILSHPFWQSRFAGDPNVLGRTFRLNGTVYTVVGVAPEGFGGMFPAVTAQMWIPLSMVEEVEPLGAQRNSGASPGDNRLERRGQHFLWLRGRMKPGTELAQVRAEFEGIASRLSALHPETNARERVRILPTNEVTFNPDLDGTVTPVGMILLGAVGLVLLVACANLANMLLARASSRRKELAVRVAMGAGRGGLVRQMLAESLLLALAGGVVAMALASWMAAFIGRIRPPVFIDLSLDITPDWRVLVFTFLVAGVTGLLFGLIPALRASRPDLVPALKDAGDGDTGRGKRWELRNVLVVAQVAVSLVLLVGGTLLVRSVGAAARVDPGYDLDRTAYFGLAMEMNGYDAEASSALFEAARLRLEARPEVAAVGLTSRLPLSLNNNGFGIFIDGHQSSGEDRPYIVDGAHVDEGYFDALGLRIVQGRAIQATDRVEGLRVAVVTEAMAARFWPDQEALGQEFRTSWGAPPHRIVGIVQDHKVDTPGEVPKPYVHLPLSLRSTFANFVVRTTTPAAPHVAALEREFRAIDPDIVFLETGTFRQLASVRIFPILAGAWLIGVFGGLALLLAAVGLYGVIGYSVSRRVREISIRKALGAESGSVVGMVLGEGMVLVAVGGAVGAVLAGLGARVLSSMLFVGPFDPLSFLTAFAVLAGIAALANWIPARRAARVDPMDALRGH
jgi:macrolide transport system ATP-binding/permease protein